MGVRDIYLQKIAFTGTAPSGQEFRLRKMSVADWVAALGGTPSLLEVSKLETKDGKVNITLDQMRETDSYQRTVVKRCVVSPTISMDDDSVDPDAIPYSMIDSADITWITSQAEALSELKGERAEEAREFPAKPGQLPEGACAAGADKREGK
jgi:hypothetical protein